MQKLEILEQFKKLYGDKINPNLLSLKYCQTQTMAFVEMTFVNNSTPIIIDLNFIGGDIIKDEQGNDIDILPMFNPEDDIVDNAKCLIELDSYSLIMCIDHLFTETAANEINDLNTNELKNE
jgi:hypothetical protein